ncbi:hypothetical protein C8R46DRAFT_1218636 [Mycena filopes]|nr:hypothetical protein C8R46DRAFT_1218636 [Mycena filopes]
MAASTQMTPDQMRTRLDELDTIIQRDGALLEQDRNQRLEITRRLGALVYPVLTLPPEITSEVFRHFVRSQCGTSVPSVLLRICTTWRDIAVADSALWTELTVNFSIPHAHKDSAAELASFLHTWIGRAQSRPLSVILGGDMVSSLGAVRSMELLRRLAPTVRRLELEITRHFDGLPESSDDLSWPTLEHLQIEAEKALTGLFGSTFATAPLRTLWLNGSPMSSVTLCWQQLTTFDGVMRFNDCIELLQVAENLLTCRLFIFDYESHSQISASRHRPTTHRFLNDLELTASLDVNSQLLPLLTLPRLCTFTFIYGPFTINNFLDGSEEDDYEPEVVDDYETEDYGPLADFLRRHSDTLANLAIDHVPARILTPLTRLTELKIAGLPPLFTSDFSALLEDPDKVFLPSLQHIT